jgi:hypothetical protein
LIDEVSPTSAVGRVQVEDGRQCGFDPGGTSGFACSLRFMPLMHMNIITAQGTRRISGAKVAAGSQY